MVRRIVVGGGISGLVAAYQLKSQQQPEDELLLLEAEEAVGGYLQTSLEDGWLFEESARTLRTTGTGTELLALVEQLALCEEVILPPPSAGGRWLWHRGALDLLPDSLRALLRSSFRNCLIKAAARDLSLVFQRGQPAEEEETIEAFGRRHFGEEATEVFFRAMTLGIYAGRTEELSLAASFPQIAEWEQRGHGSCLLGLLRSGLAGKIKSVPPSPWVRQIQRSAPFFSFRRGLSTLVGALASALTAETLLKTRVESITRDEKGGSLLRLARGGELTADELYLAVPGKVVPALFREESQLPGLLMPFRSRSLAVVCLGWNRELLSHSGFGYLVPESGGRGVLGAIWDSKTFPQQNLGRACTRISFMVGEPTECSDEELQRLAIAAARDHLGIETAPDYCFIKNHPMAVPQYRLGHSKAAVRLKAFFQERHPSLRLLGNAFDGVGIGDLVTRSKRVAQHIPMGQSCLSKESLPEVRVSARG